jgi:hypothetical protein
MILIYMILAFALTFLSGLHWCIYKVETVDQKPNAWKYAAISVACGLIGVYNMISMIGVVR